MPTSKELQSIALGIAMLIVWTVAEFHTQGRSQGEKITSQSNGGHPLMSPVRTDAGPKELEPAP